MTTEADQIDQLLETLRRDCLPAGGADLISAYVSTQRQALTQAQAELPDLRANVTKALDLLNVLTSTKYTDRAFVEAVDEADEMLEQLRGKVVLKGQAGRQETQGAQADEFQRDDRYIVIKRKDLEKAPTLMAHALRVALNGLREHLPKRECLVIENDWPEYEPTWKAIQARVSGQVAQVEDEREAFSSWAHEKGFCLDCAFFEEGNNFEDPDTRLAYEIWLARAAIATRPAVRGVEHE